MLDREKVIKAIDICLGHGKCHDCGYRIKGGYSTMDCRKPMMREALALLKEQEAVNKNIGEWKNGHCSCCGEDVSSMLDTWTNVQKFLFCPNCGAKM